MKMSHKIGLAAAGILFLAISTLSWVQVSQVKSTMSHQVASDIGETSDALARQIENWLGSKLALIDMMAQQIDGEFTPARIQSTFDTPLLKQEFLLIFGGLDSDGKRITNDKSWDPANWDARQRPWYGVAKAANQAVLTEPYPDAASGEILISAVAKLSEKGQFKGAFGGDLSLKTVSDALNTASFNGAGYAFLLAGNGNIVSHPDNQWNGKNYTELLGSRVPLEKNFTTIEHDGRELMLSFTPLSNLKGMDWYIGVVLDAEKVNAAASAVQARAMVGIVIGVLISLVLLGMLTKALLHPLDALSGSLQEMNRGEGDLTRRLPDRSQDEFGLVAREFNGFVGYLQELISDVMFSASQIKGSCQQTSDEAYMAADRLQQQLQELDQLATAMNQMASTANEVAQHAQAAAHAAHAANEETEQGVSVVSRSTSAIQRLADEMEQTGAAVNDLARFSQNIESILSVITSIAEQTNLLALNAAIEAARAGESGRGFAVVADEVRSLASRTQQSTREIREMIDQLQVGVRQTEEKMRQSRDIASQTAQDAQEANEVLGRIRDAISQINDMNLQIAAAAEEQSSTTEEINRNTTNIRDISQEVSQGAEQQAQHCLEMRGQIDQQLALLGRFRV
ncbi:methyl-accepting chemotaxis protein [Aeromonas schubertii]|uniref:Methyl-accepting chemotaxis protein n=1 Tax=Aeromonas schubertii TaxID=652 RepID=A0ABS7VAH2_9GAMM|nr:methyl-accepting chemotaxis protein [Aeromonas schubertii]MBZ6065923.1 methyl-accepting chemotaxis protein [Aeromonas schubertii]MBZ6072683.1 methyl-accepting chemotaxis protein [Aeromonas schubertii]